MATGASTLTPIASGVPGSGSIAEALPRTHLSLFRYAKILGIPPLHFAGALTPALSPQVFPAEGCDSIWPRYSWQDRDQVSHDDLARAIYDAESDIASQLGYPVAPEFVAEEVIAYPKHHRSEMYGARIDARWRYIGVQTRYGKVTGPGRRKVTLVGTATTAGSSLIYQDLDGDGFAERARIQLATSLTDANEIRVYFTGKSGAQAWEVRPVLAKAISGGTLTVTLPSWTMIDPDLQSAYPTSDGLTAIDASTTAAFVSSVDVYREQLDSTQVTAQFLWEPETNIDVTKADGSFVLRDYRLGIIAPSLPEGTITPVREPSRIKVWYQAGNVSDEYLRGESYDPLSDVLAHPIAWLATARLERAFCQCGNTTALADHWREDLARNTREASQLLAMNLLDNPFGTRRGELMAWQRISKMMDSVRLGGAV